MKRMGGFLVAALMALRVPCRLRLQVKHLQPNENSPIANGVWAGDTLYLSGQLASR